MIGLLLAIGCGPEVWDLGSPGPARLPVDEALGEVRVEEASLRDLRIALGAGGTEPVLVVQYSAGFDGDLVRVDATSEVWLLDSAQVLQGPDPLPSSTEITVGSALGSARAALLLDGALWVEDGAWNELPALPGATDLIAWSASSALATTEGATWTFDGTWTRVPAPAGAVPVSVDGGVTTVAWTEPGLCEADWDGTSLGSPRCWPELLGSYVLPGLNGTPAAHQLMMGVQPILARPVRVQGTEATANLPVVVTRAHHTVGRDTLVTENADPYGPPTPVPYFLAYQGAALTAWQDDFFVDRDCACDIDADASCGCVARPALALASAPRADATGTIVALIDRPDSVVRMHTIDLPFDHGDPLHPPAPCAGECGEAQRCDLQAWGEPMCETFDSLFDPIDGVPINVVNLVVDYPLEPIFTPLQVTVTPLSPTEATHRLRNTVTDTVSVELDPESHYRIEVHLDGYSDIVVEDIDSGPLGTFQTLGPFVRSPGAQVGLGVDWSAGSTTAVDRTTGAVLLHVGDGWHLVRGQADALEVVPVWAAVAPTERAHLAPMGDLAVVSDGTAVAVLDLDAAASLGQRPGDFAPANASFGGGRVALVATDGSVEVVTASSGLPSVRTLPAATGPALLSPDGTWLARREGTEVALYEVASGDRTATGVTVGASQFVHLAFSDDSADLFVGAAAFADATEVPCTPHNAGCAGWSVAVTAPTDPLDLGSLRGLPAWGADAIAVLAIGSYNGGPNSAAVTIDRQTGARSTVTTRAGFSPYGLPAGARLVFGGGVVSVLDVATGSVNDSHAGSPALAHDGAVLWFGGLGVTELDPVSGALTVTPLDAFPQFGANNELRLRVAAPGLLVDTLDFDQVTGTHTVWAGRGDVEIDPLFTAQGGLHALCIPVQRGGGPSPDEGVACLR